MKNKKNILILVLSAALLASCSAASDQKKVETTYADATPDNPYGAISNFSRENDGTLKAGDQLSFHVQAAEDFFIDKIVVNGEVVATETEDKTSGDYTITLAEGKNRINAYYRIDKTIDFVDRFKLSDVNVDVGTFNSISVQKDNYGKDGSYKAWDFRTHGIEEMKTTYLDDDAFVNFVDGDTTHVETCNYGYTVKIRYLSIDTPESTSEIEKWGKAAALFNQSKLQNAKHIILTSQGWATGAEDKHSETDGNQRDLAYVWYTDKETPRRTDYRCLNLEMVYEGYSFGIGSPDDGGDKVYRIFDKAQKSAEANKRHLFSSDTDPLYDDDGPEDLTLKQIYQHTTQTTVDKVISVHCDYVDEETHRQNLYRVRGYVSRKLEGAFWIQDKPSYEGETPEAYGMYVFTYAQTSIMPGDEVEVIGALSVYSGTLQINGISWHDIDPNPERDTVIKSSGNTIVPISLTAAQYASHPYDFVLCEIEEDIVGYNKVAQYGIHSEGGSHEINEYNTHFPFYNTNNKLTTFGHIGSSTGPEIRVTITDGVILRYRTEVSYSHKFLGGGTNYYLAADPSKPYEETGAALVYNKSVAALEAMMDPNSPTYQPTLVKEVYTQKTYHVTGIMGNYISTSGKNQVYQVNVVSPADVKIKAAA